jgi:beta-galactosidase
MSQWTRRNVLKTGLAASVVRGATIESGQPSEAPGAEVTPAAGRERLLFDHAWRFHLGNADDAAQDFEFGHGLVFAKSNEATRVALPNYDDSQWRTLDLPHDWAVELPFVDDPETVANGSKPLGRKYPATSIGWYRRVFAIPQADLGRRIAVEFDGVFRDAMVFLNGHYIGRNLSGYAPFRYDLSDFLNYGGENALAVRVDATEHEGWFYEGAGIYRHVWLTKTHPLHVAHWGAYVTAEVQGAAARLHIALEMQNEADTPDGCNIVCTVFDPSGNGIGEWRVAGARLGPWERREFRGELGVSRAELWSLEKPQLYRMTTSIQRGGAEVDRYETPFGIRTIHFDPDNGFFLNGERVEIQGTCNHQDHAGVGSALPDRLQAFRIERLKSMGSNGYRTSHNPPTPELLDACDRLGMLVMDETRMMSSDPEGLSQLERLIRRDRNHPCVILWSIGNEEPVQGTPRGARIASTMKRLARGLDPTRPITEAQNNENSWGKGLSAVVDVQGFNYGKGENMDAYHREFPQKPCMGSETASTVSTRGEYANDKEKGYVSAYDVNFPRWAATAESWWSTYDARRFLAGGFAWTGFDYRGEPTPYGWPCINSHFGIVDTCGFPKDNYYYYQAWWSGKPVLHLFPHWNWLGREGQPIDVWCHSNADRVELLLNGESLGSKDVPKNGHVGWQVTFAPGTIEARGYKGGRHTLTARRETTGTAAKLVLSPDRATIGADGEDASVVAVHAVDAHGRMVPTADDEIQFDLAGGGRILGVGNGDPSSHEPDKASRRRLFNGLAMAVVQAPAKAGEIRVTASAPGLESATVILQCEAKPVRPRVA